MKIILPLLLVPLASSLKPFDDHHVEIVQVSAGNIAGHCIWILKSVIQIYSAKIDAQDFGDELLVREKRDSGLICKYKKGEWSRCDHLTQVIKEI